jgi:hypothetical protein
MDMMGWLYVTLAAVGGIGLVGYAWGALRSDDFAEFVDGAAILGLFIGIWGFGFVGSQMMEVKELRDELRALSATVERMRSGADPAP